MSIAILKPYTGKFRDNERYVVGIPHTSGRMSQSIALQLNKNIKNWSYYKAKGYFKKQTLIIQHELNVGKVLPVCLSGAVIKKYKRWFKKPYVIYDDNEFQNFTKMLYDTEARATAQQEYSDAWDEELFKKWFNNSDIPALNGDKRLPHHIARRLKKEKEAKIHKAVDEKFKQIMKDK